MAFAKRRAELLGYVVTKPDPVPAPQAWDADLIPDVVYEPTPASEERLEIDAVLRRVDVLEAYNRWIGKMTPDVGGKTKNIMISCPLPTHPDKHPSASIDLSKGDGGVWACHACQDGGDKYDLAAIRFGFARPDYKGKDFPELRRRMAESLGYKYRQEGKAEWLVKPTQPITPDSAGGGAATTEEAPARAGLVTQQDEVPPALSVVQPSDDGPALDWRALGCITSDTFLYEWMNATSALYEPEEFYLFGGLLALGSAVGNSVTLDDEPNVRANMMVCLVGTTGAGKSRSIANLSKLISTALPFKEDNGGGVKLVNSSGSGEDLISQFCYSTVDSTTGERTSWPINGLYEEDELEGLMARIARPAGTFRSTLMKFFDTSRPISASSKTNGLSVAKDHFLQLVSSTQPKRLGDLTTGGDATSGFLNRWFFVFGGEKFRPAISQVRLDIDQSVDLLRNVRAWSSGGKLVRFADPAANQYWEKFVQENVRPIESSDDALAGRISLQCKKLLLLFSINQRMTVITIQHIEALANLFPYIKMCYGIVEQNVGKTQLQGCIDAMLKYFESHPDTDLTDRILAKQSGAKKYDAATRVQAYEKLLRLQVIMEVRGRNESTHKYRLVPENQIQLASVTSIS